MAATSGRTGLGAVTRAALLLKGSAGQPTRRRRVAPHCEREAGRPKHSRPSGSRCRAPAEGLPRDLPTWPPCAFPHRQTWKAATWALPCVHDTFGGPPYPPLRDLYIGGCPSQNGYQFAAHRRDRPPPSRWKLQIRTTEMHQVAEYGNRRPLEIQGRRITATGGGDHRNASTGFALLVVGRGPGRRQSKDRAGLFALPIKREADLFDEEGL